MKTTGLNLASLIPVGMTLEAATWHLAGLYGPGAAHATERDALVEGIADVEARVKAHEAHYGPYRHSYVPLPEQFSIDLRWKMRWTQGAPDANGRTTHASGETATIQRTTYESLDDARAHLARIDKHAVAP